MCKKSVWMGIGWMVAICLFLSCSEEKESGPGPLGVTFPEAVQEALAHYFPNQEPSSAEELNHEESGELRYLVTYGTDAYIIVNAEGEWQTLGCSNRPLPEVLQEEYVNQFQTIAQEYPSDEPISLQRAAYGVTIGLMNGELLAFEENSGTILGNELMGYDGKEEASEILPNAAYSFSYTYFSEYPVQNILQPMDKEFSYKVYLDRGLNISFDASNQWVVAESTGDAFLPSTFLASLPDEVKDEAKEIPQEVTAAQRRGRVDLRDVPFVTIDGEDARDFDDAVYCEKSGDGWRLLVAIADVSQYVKPDHPLDREAQARGTSVYFPTAVIPMLPEALSNGICSLNPNVDRLTMVCDALIDAEGKTTAYQFYPAVIRSHARLTYTQVWSALSGEDAGFEALGERLFEVERLYELYKVLHAAREKRFALDFESSEIKALINEEKGTIDRFEPYRITDANRLIEECMLVANVAAADFVLRNEKLTLFRVHDKPEEERLQDLRRILRAYKLKLSENSPAGFAALLESVKKSPSTSPLQIAVPTSDTTVCSTSTTRTLRVRSGATPICSCTARSRRFSPVAPTIRSFIRKRESRASTRRSSVFARPSRSPSRTSPRRSATMRSGAVWGFSVR